MSKADTLKNLNGKLKLFHIPKFYSFSVADWNTSEEKIMENILEIFKNEIMITVRSSAIDEDKSDSSSAGKYLSILNIDLKDKKII